MSGIKGKTGIYKRTPEMKFGKYKRTPEILEKTSGPNNHNWKGGWTLDKIETNRRNKERHNERRKKVLDYYGKKCICCGEIEIKFLAIDHINNDGAEHRKKIFGRKTGDMYWWIVKNNYPKGFQILCHNCNFSKGLYGKCPHKL